MLQMDGAEKLRTYAKTQFIKEIVKVDEGVYFFTGYGHSNVILIEGAHFCILVDTLDSDARARCLRQEISLITDKPVKTIIYTHSHPDHCGGAGVFADTVEKILAFAPKKSALCYTEKINDILLKRGSYQFGYALTDEQVITQGLGIREGHCCQNGMYDFLPPTIIYDQERVELELDGVTVHLISAVGETEDQLFVWLPQKKVLCSGDTYYACWPNLSAIRGGQYRDISRWIHSLDKMLSYPAKALLPGHGKALLGSAVIQETLKNYRDAMEFVLLETLKGINQGKTADQLADKIRLPEQLQKLPYLEEFYGAISWSVRGIFSGYVGWFDGNPTNLHPLPPVEQAQNMLQLVGGAEKLKEQIKQAVQNEHYQWAMWLCDILLESRQQIEFALQYKALCCQKLAEQETSANGRHYYLAAAQEYLQQQVK